MSKEMKVVEVDDQRWQIRYLSPLDGSYIWQRLMAAMFRAQTTMPANEDVQADAIAAKTISKATPEERLRTLCGIAFQFLSYEDMSFAQRKSMTVLSRLENLGGVETPMPVMDDSGRWAVSELETDPFLVTKLMVEVLVYNLASFLSVRNAPTPSQPT